MAALSDPCLQKTQPKLYGREASVSNIFPQLLLDLRSEDIKRRLLAAQDLVAYEEHLQASQLNQLIPFFKEFLFADLSDEDAADLCTAAAQFFTPLAEAEAGSVDHPSDSVNEAVLESRPAAGWIPTLLDWGAVPRLINLMNWPNQADTRPWPGAHAAAGGRLLCALAAHQNVQAHEQMLQLEAVPALLHALEEAWLNTCSAEILFYLADSPVPGTLDRLRMSDGAAILVGYVSRNVNNRRKRMRSYGPTAAENPPYHEVACLYYAVQLLILLAVRPDGDGDDAEEDTLKLGLPVPTQDIVEALQAVLGLMPPPKLAAAVQKLINCCPEARAALEEQALSSQDGRGYGWFSKAWNFMKGALEDPRETELAKSEKAV